MTDEQRKKPGVTFWATVVVLLLPVVYPLSAGPYASAYLAIGGGQRSEFSELLPQGPGAVSIGYKSSGMPYGATPSWLWRGPEWFYAPLTWAAGAGPEWFRRPFNAYLDWWLRLVVKKSSHTPTFVVT